MTATVAGIGDAAQGPTGNVSFVSTTNNNHVLGTAGLGPSTRVGGFVNALESPIAGFTAGLGSPLAAGLVSDLAVSNSDSDTVSILMYQVAQTATAELTGVSLIGAGIHDVNATFPGAANFKNSTSPTTPVAPSSPTTTIASSGSVGNYTLTAAVVGTGNFTHDPTGSVSFVDATTSDSVLGAAPLGAATLAQNSINAPGSPVGVNSSPFSVAVGDFNRDGIPDLAVTDEDSAMLTPGAAGANTAFLVTASKQSSSLIAVRGRSFAPAAFALLRLPFACLKRNHKRPQPLRMWMLVSLISLSAIAGCGAGGYFSQPRQTYTITVTGTSANLSHSTTLTIQ